MHLAFCPSRQAIEVANIFSALRAHQARKPLKYKGYSFTSLRLNRTFLQALCQQVWCSEASCHSSGCKSHQQRSPVAVVVITSNGKGDRPVGSLVVKVPDGREIGRIRTGGQATWQAVANV